MKKNIFLSLCVSSLLLNVSFAHELTQLQAQISQQKSTVDSHLKNKKSLQNEVNALKKELQQSAKNLHQLQQKILKTKQKQNEIQQEQQRLQSKLHQQKEELKEIIHTIYQAKLNPNFLEKILGEQPAKNLVLKQYMQRLYAQKTQLLQALQNNEKALVAQNDALKNEQEELQKQQAELSQLQQKQKISQENYQQRLTQLQEILTLEQKKLAELIANEKALQAQIAKAKQQALLRQQEARNKALLSLAQRGLGPAKYQHSAPVKGKILHTFGSHQLGELRWSGVVIQAPFGTKVKAIYPGEVISASKLAGYGWLIVLKHGEKDLSLYGYNQNINVKVGDVVQAGQVIAHVGQINGEQQSGLYFKITRCGESQNPLLWLKK